MLLVELCGTLHPCYYMSFVATGWALPIGQTGSMRLLVEQQLLEHQEQRLQCGQHQVELAHVLRGEQARVLRRVQRDVEVQILSARRRHGGQRHDGHGGLLYARRGDARQTLEPGLQGGQRVQLRLQQRLRRRWGELHQCG